MRSVEIFKRIFINVTVAVSNNIVIRTIHLFTVRRLRNVSASIKGSYLLFIETLLKTIADFIIPFEGENL